MISNSLWIISEKLYKLFLNLLVTGLIARYLGINIFGELNYSISLLAIGTVLCSLGFNRIVVKNLSIHSSNKNVVQEIISTAFFLRIFVSFFVFFIFVLILFFDDSYFLTSSVIVFISFFFSSSDIIEFYYQSIASIKKVSLIKIISFTISSIFKCLLVYLNTKPIWFFVAITLEYIVTFILIFLLQYRLKFLNILYVKFSTGLELLKESWTEIFAGFSSILFMKLDQIMLMNLNGSNSVGIYSAASKISEAWYFVPVAIVTATFPYIINCRNDSKLYIGRISALFSLLISLSYVVILFFTFFSSLIIKIIFGSAYEESAIILIIHCWAGLFLCMGIISGSWLVIEKKLKYNLYRTIFGLVINIVLNYFLIPIYGAVGASIATVIAFLFAFFLSDLLFKPLHPMFILKIKALTFYSQIKFIKIILKNKGLKNAI